MDHLTSHVRIRRERAGLRPVELARAVGITRQALHSIETGAYVPNTLIALHLARALDCAVEELFTLEDAQVQAKLLGTKLLDTATPAARVQLAQLGGEWLAFPLAGQGAWGEQADGLITAQTKETARVKVLDHLDLPRRTAVVAGCDPSLALLASHVTRHQPGTRVLLHAVSSLEALHALQRGEAHAAGIHLWDAASGESNIPFVQRELPGRAMQIFTLWSWEQGLMVAPGNPHGIAGVSDLLRPGVRLQNREPEAGSRVLLDTWLDTAKVSQRERQAISGYQDEVNTPLGAAQRVASGAADVAPGPKSAALALGLAFIPLQVERFDLVVPDEFVQHPALTALLEVVQQSAFRTELMALGGYDPAHAGERWTATA